VAISSFLAPSAIAKPGVCTSSTRPASPYEGQVIYETDTDRALVWDGAAWEYLATGTPNPVGLELITSCTASFTGGSAGSVSNGVITIGTTNTAVAVSNAFSASFDNYKILVQGGSASTNAGYFTLQLGSTTSNYRYDYISANLASATPTSVGSVGAPNFPYVGYKSSTLMATIELIGPFATGMTMICCSAGQTGNNMGMLNGVQIDATSFTGFTLGTSTGTFSGGTIRVYGYRN
jgi:hypothetical protein